MIETNIVVGSGMKINCGRDELVAKLSVVARAVSTRTAVQILSGILLRAEDGELHLSATDMELSLRTSLRAEVEGEGAVVVPIVCGPSNYRLNTYSAADFPRLPAVDRADLYPLERETLLEAIGRVQRS